MAPSTAISSTSSQQPENGRRRSLSGASALLTRRFTRSSNTQPRSTPSKSESTAKRRATIANTPDDATGAKVHVRIVPNIENPSRSLIFDIVDRVLEVGSVIRIGRYSERHTNLNCMSFKSKVVSRCHCEVWVETDSKLYIRDTKSSSGTFLNHVRLSPAGNESGPVELHDGDIVQLGVDFQGGREEIYRSVKMRFELNRSSRPRPLSFNLNAFQNLRNLTQQQPPLPNNSFITPFALSPRPEEEEEQVSLSNENHINTNTNNNVQHQNSTFTAKTTNTNDTNTKSNTMNEVSAIACHGDVDECCICLYALAPFQALFVSPCSHTYHFKCIRPLLQSYPGFQCPICRTYSDLEASVAIEADEVLEKCTKNGQHERSNKIAVTSTAPPADSGLSLQSNTDLMTHNNISPLENHHDTNASSSSSSAQTPEAEVVSREDRHSNNVPVNVRDSYSTSYVSTSPVIYSENLPDNTPVSCDVDNNHPNDEENHDGGVISNTDGEEEEEVVGQPPITTTTTNTNNVTIIRQTTANTTDSIKRERRSSHIMEKIKMVFFEKRKSVSIQHNKQRANKNRQRPLSYPNMLSTVETRMPYDEPPLPIHNNTSSSSSSASPSTSNTPLSQTLSRQSTRLATSDEEDEIPRPLMMII